MIRRQDKPRIRWSGRFQHWFHYGSWVFGGDCCRTALNFVLEINTLNGRRN